MRNTIEIDGIPIDKVTMNEAVEIVKCFLTEEKTHTIYTPNAEIMMAALEDPELYKILCEADMLVADGAGVVLGSRILGRSVPEKVSGIDLVKNTFSIKLDRKIKYYLFGGKPGIAEVAGENILKDYSNIEISGFTNGFFSYQDEKEIVNKINSSGSDILLVALGVPKQEKWISRYRDDLKVKVCIGVGGSLDVFAGKVNLAPDFFRKNGLEWLYRLYKEPWRFKRMLKLPKLIFHVLYLRLKKR
jgi:N-acetylglucosaminyldiphosphoundecaprenol N-acetyl-beta-D-mannosaminyltransferase